MWELQEGFCASASPQEQGCGFDPPEETTKGGSPGHFPEEFLSTTGRGGNRMGIHIPPPKRELSQRGLFLQKALQTDCRFLCRILSNLVHNAVKFTDEGGLWIQGESSGEGVRLMVRDTGMGIDPEKQDQLFDAFRQGTEGRDRTHEGTGLGLALTKRMVEVLGGTIRVDSTKGEGSTFAVELPSLSIDGAAADLADRSVDRATGTGP